MMHLVHDTFRCVKRVFYYMGTIMRASAALGLTWVLLPLNQLSSSLAEG